jgi:DNA repair exonuclease SbcCD ATPase subunit
MEEKLQGAIDAARQKAEEAKRQLEEGRNQLAAANTAKVVPAASSSAHLCPKCNTPFSAGDAFCGGCGNRLS